MVSYRGPKALQHRELSWCICPHTLVALRRRATIQCKVPCQCRIETWRRSARLCGGSTEKALSS